VFFCNRKINTAEPNLMDIAPTVLEQFGVDVPAYMQGKSLFAPGEGAGVGGGRTARATRGQGAPSVEGAAR
jgi:arylsulfatase A-like enzyme